MYYTYTPAEPAVAAPPALPTRTWADVRNLLLLAAGWAAFVLIISPQHEYPVIDDWAYAGSVRHMLDTGTFQMPPSAQTNLVGLTVWGTLWARQFGFGFTVLTASTLFMAAIALFAFYALARTVDVSPGGALLGTALLGFNPLFVHLSYSFMTDVPFLALMLLSCLCYVRGCQTRGVAWLVLGSLFVAWAFLIRQLGLLVPLAFLVYLALDGWPRRDWRVRDMIALALVPALVAGGWWLLTRDIPPNPAGATPFLFKASWLQVILLRSLNLLPFVAFSAWAALTWRTTRRRLILLWAVLIPALMLLAQLPGGTWLNVPAPSLTLALGPLTVRLPQQLFVFGTTGNVLRIGGIDFYDYQQEPLWTPQIWWALWVIGVVLGVLLVAKISDGLLDWVQGQRQTPREPLSPLAALYIVGLLIFLATVAFAGTFFDRYALAFLPFVILFVVRGAREWGDLAWAYSLAALLVVAVFAGLLKTDQIAHANARWEVAQWVQARSGGVHAGWEWDHWVPGGVNKSYQVSDIEVPGFRTDYRLPYRSLLSGGATRYVLGQAENHLPPLTGRGEGAPP
jgi:4-amino-4-deoxy-L-arabinose transferase-like glycosyltransferase